MKDCASVIPTSDPSEALGFCRGLAAFLKQREVMFEESPSTTELSVVIPVFNEEENIGELYSRLTGALDQLGLSFELIFVDDGSRDRSVEMLAVLSERDRRITVVELSRNFGHQVAISAGIDFASGENVAVIDADLQDPPEVLKDLLAKRREGYDVVYAVRQGRKESWFKRAAYATFYRLLCRVSNVDIPLDAGDFCVMDRKVVDLLKAMPERNRFVRGIRSWIGLRQVGLPYERRSRHAGRPKYTLGRLMVLAMDGLVSFSHMPLRIASLVGFGISCAALLLAAYYFIKRLVVGLEPRGFATLIVAILFMAGIQIIAVGVVGEYVGRIFDEVKRRPLYVVSRVRSPRVASCGRVSP